MLIFVSRYTVTVGGSSWTVRYLSKKGYMTGAELKENITDSSDKLKVRYQKIPVK
jgi:hypothetical protein